MSCVASDRALMVAIARGDKCALAALYDRHCATMLFVAQAILRDPADAEDLVHDVFIDMWHHAGSYDSSRGRVGTWLRTRTRSRAIDRLRAKKAAAKYEVAAGLQRRRAPRAENDPAAVLTHGRLAEALERLSEPVRRVVQLTHLEGYTCNELARHWNVPLGTVKSRLARGMEQLREQLAAGKEVG